MYDEQPRQEWLLLRQDAAQITYVLSNAPESMDLKTMAWRKTHRFLIERSNEDAKDEFGWDEFQTAIAAGNINLRLFWHPGLWRRPVWTGFGVFSKAQN